MELPASPSSPQFGMRKPGEPGLAEWAQKIRALQRQVDEDEEEEHRKLEQEITASRLARVRRSTGYGRAPLDPAAVHSGTPSTTSRHSDAPEFAKSSTVRRGEQAETPQKLVNKPAPRPQTAPSSPAPISLAAFIGGRAAGPRLNKHAPQVDATDPTLFEQRNITSSSAPHPVFGRGGIAIPGLTSRGRTVVSPTLDNEVHSPTPTGPKQVHFPVVKYEPALSETESTPVLNSDHRPGGEASRQPRTSTPSTALRRYVQHVEQVASAPASKPSLERDVPRSRTVSTPTGTHPTRTATLPPPALQSQSRPVSPRSRVPSRSPNLDVRSPPAALDNNPPLAKYPTHPSSKLSTPTLTTPKKSPAASTSSPAFSVKLPTFSASTPSLPRPEVSTPNAIPHTPQRRTPSLHPPMEKDPTPSISRLKGRGFVQSMVKASSVLEAAAAGSTVPEVGKLSPSKRPSPVTGRWKPESSSPQTATMPDPTNFRKSWTPAATTPSTQSTVAHRKSWTSSEPLKIEESARERPPRALDQQLTGRSARVVESHLTGRSAHAVENQHLGPSPGHELTGRSIRKSPSQPPSSAPSRPTTPPPASPGGHGLGSSSTMFSYIKPVKTGDDPATGHPHTHSRPSTPHARASASDMTSMQDADELGHRMGVGSGGQGQRSGVAGFPTPSGRPLVHLTKGRPKPKKVNRKNADEQLAEMRHTKVPARAPGVPVPVQSAVIEAATPISSRTCIAQPFTRANATTSYVNVPTELSTHPLTTKPERPSTNTTDGDAQALGVRWSDSAVPDHPKKPSIPGHSLPSSSPQNLLPSQPSSALQRPARRQSRIPSTGSRTLVMDVAQALQEAHVSTTDAEATIKGPVSPVAPRRTEPQAPLIEKRKSSSDKYSGPAMPLLVEERTSTTRGVNSGLAVQTGLEIDSDARAQEQASPSHIPPSQQDDSSVEIRE
ncbi:hypothetical protein BC826DRAFT_177664 [Russula brevipes]|nr:hypothetical protein BC826DRAFT_177664 [Russula brevipes]